MTITCPKCSATHDRGFFDGVGVGRCLKCGITFKAGPDGKALDPRIVNGARCMWWGHISEAGVLPSGIPCCPHCFGVLLQTESIEAWWAIVDAHDKLHPGYRTIVSFAGRAHYRARFEVEAAISAAIVEVRNAPESAAAKSSREQLEERINSLRQREAQMAAKSDMDLAKVYIARSKIDASERALRLIVALARRVAITTRNPEPPKPGELVIEVTAFRADPNAIGVLVGHDVAPYHPGDPTDGTVPMREVWDIIPLSGEVNPETGFARWENAEFVALPESVQRIARELDIIPKVSDGD
jgi:hypothetical protein